MYVVLKGGDKGGTGGEDLDAGHEGGHGGGTGGGARRFARRGARAGARLGARGLAGGSRLGGRRAARVNPVQAALGRVVLGQGRRVLGGDFGLEARVLCVVSGACSRDGRLLGDHIGIDAAEHRIVGALHRAGLGLVLHVDRGGASGDGRIGALGLVFW